MSSANVALVAGGLGVIGRALVEHFAARDGWDVVALSRRAPDFHTSARYESADLLDVASTRSALARIGRVTHIFYAAYQEHKDPTISTSVNLGMLRTLVEAADALPDLKRVVLYEGVKYYGVHLGPFKTPAKEDDARHLPPNFYYDQEDWLRAQAAGKPLGHGGAAAGRGVRLRGRQPDEPHAGHRRLCRNLQGTRRAAALPRLGRRLEGAGASDRCRAAGACLGIRGHNGPGRRSLQCDQRRPVPLGAAVPAPSRSDFGMPHGTPLPLPLSSFMADKAPVWQRIVAKHDLAPYAYETIAAWGFGDFIFNCGYDVISSTTKLRQAGFAEVVDSQEMFLRMFAEFRRRRVIPRRRQRSIKGSTENG